MEKEGCQCRMHGVYYNLIKFSFFSAMNYRYAFNRHLSVLSCTSLHRIQVPYIAVSSFTSCWFVDEHTSTHKHMDTCMHARTHSRTHSIFENVCECVCVCRWKKGKFEEYQSCAHFRDALSVPHQSNPTTTKPKASSPSLSPSTTTKIATPVWEIVIQRRQR